MAGSMRRKLILLSGLLMISTALSAETPFEAGVQAYGKGDYAGARQNWEQALSAGDWEAARNLGLLYRKGLGVEADASKAASYYQQAADHGVANAEMNLAELYLSGQGVPKDIDKAKQLLKDAADHGSLPARFRLDEVQDAEDRANGGLALTAPSQGAASAPASAPVSPLRQAKPVAEAASAPAPVPASAAPAVKAKPPVVPPASVPAAAKAAPTPITPIPITPQAVAQPEPVAPPPPQPTPEPPSPQKLADMAQESAPPPPMPEPEKVPEKVPEKLPEKVAEQPAEKPAAQEPEKPAAEIPAAAADAPPEPVKDVDPAGKTDDQTALEAGQLRLHVASYRNESDAARGWLSYNLPGLIPELAAVTIPGKGKFIRLFAVGPSEQVHQLCDEMKARGEVCTITDVKK